MKSENSIELQVGVKAFLRNTEGKYLLLKRSSKYGNTAGSWDIVGGRINPGTELIENLKREVKEETGLSILGEAKLIYAQDILRVHGKHIVRLSYTAEAEGEIALDTEESTEYKWLSLKEMKELSDLDVFVREILEKGIVS